MTKSVVRRSKCGILAVRGTIQIGSGIKKGWRQKRTKQDVIRGESPFKLGGS